MRPTIFLFGILLTASIGVAQQTPKLSNAQLSTQDGGTLQAEIARVTGVAWLGYAIQTVRPVNSDEQKVYLEGGHQEDIVEERPPDAPAPWANVLLRVAGGHVQRVSLQPSERELDAGGLPFVWINGVNPADSIRTLSGIAEAESKAMTGAPVSKDVERDHQRLLERSLMIVAQTDAPEATAAVQKFTDVSYPEKVREKAAFWLAEARGSEGFHTDVTLLKNDKDDALRQQLVFDLTLVKGASQPVALDTLLSTAKNDPSLKVRERAQFWLAQMAGKKAEAAAAADPRIGMTLSEEARQDPNASLRKSAVFALSRLPDDQGIPKLIEVADSSADPATRREAIFWLGQKKDPRALAYLEKIVRQ